MNTEMSEQPIVENGVATPVPSSAESTGADTSKPSFDRGARGGARRERTGGRPTGPRKGSRFESRPKPEFDQKIINISRVTRVVKGGRRLSFRVDMVIGDKKGKVGIGSGKATDTSLAIQKAFNVARKNLLYLKLTPNKSIAYETSAKVTASVVYLMPNKERGLVAGSTMRNVLELAGMTDVTGRVMSGSKNKLNIAKATIEALRLFDLPIEERPKPAAPQAERRSFRAGGNRGDRRPRTPRRTPNQA